MPTPTYDDIGLANELKNWLICMWRFKCNRRNPQWEVERLRRFYAQTRHYIQVRMLARSKEWQIYPKKSVQ